MKQMQSQNISDIIEKYLKSILADAEHVEIRRSEIADLFNVVPSQINYVIKTRFTIQNGYLVESKRGGGGYIRIEKVNLLDDADVLDTLIQVIGDSITQRDAYAVVQSLYEDEVLNRREAQLILVATDRNTLGVDDHDLENSLRARIIIGILNHLRYES
ncbi:transcriptional regulator ctsr [Lactiplantibacillus fabifermentans DSM 21115]|uniref:Transcriptional regulator CtsR n=2 Tax=Lactiplantibacillus fabifermentans TaxID=483011 RepID=A0A0R2NQK7_9LACO|nr:transcriptional regulator ctsr [Lactiplantibacillus fabifermentans DSM 21115]